MAVTAALVFAGGNRLRYLVTSDAGGGTAAIPSTGGATPDLQTDTESGPLKQLSLARDQGIGSVGGAALTQAQARGLWLSDATGGPYGNDIMPRAICRITPRTGATTWLVDADVDGQGYPEINVTGSAAAGTCYLDIEVPGAVGIN